eukprot:TRINITY_DN5939_c0_g1_i1.p2 TRINITY_DN5939_c0_g1~~TRINITY_DN5939_c0_g1_i1.p2  ORF type:complete len:108 (+),score=43.20 TRINITY_DN5939_c0_g1_i1:56-379(+)
MGANTELGMMYSALICEDCGVDKSGSNLVSACKAAGITVNAGKADIFANLFEKVDLSELLGNMSVGGGGAAPADSSAPAGGDDKPAAAAAPVEESEGDDDMGFGLFD